MKASTAANPTPTATAARRRPGWAHAPTTAETIAAAATAASPTRAACQANGLPVSMSRTVATGQLTQRVYEPLPAAYRLTRCMVSAAPNASHAQVAARTDAGRPGRDSRIAAETMAAMASTAEPRSAADTPAGKATPMTMPRPTWPATSAPATVTHGSSFTARGAFRSRRASTAAARASGPARIAEVRCTISIQGLRCSAALTGPSGSRAPVRQPGQLPPSEPDSVAQTTDPRATATMVQAAARRNTASMARGTGVGITDIPAGFPATLDPLAAFAGGVPTDPPAGRRVAPRPLRRPSGGISGGAGAASARGRPDRRWGWGAGRRPPRRRPGGRAATPAHRPR